MSLTNLVIRDRHMRNINNQGMEWTTEEITEDLKNTHLYIGELIKKLEQKIKSKNSSNATEVSIDNSATKMLHLVSKIATLTQFVPRVACTQ